MGELNARDREATEGLPDLRPRRSHTTDTFDVGSLDRHAVILIVEVLEMLYLPRAKGILLLLLLLIWIHIDAIVVRHNSTMAATGMIQTMDKCKKEGREL